MIDLQPVTLAQLLQPVVTAGIGLAQCVLIWTGLRQMRAASAARDRQLDATDRKTDAQLEALSVLIERTGGRGTV
jgi:hypothetical protein